MGTGKPRYDLHVLQRLIGQGPISSTITRAAADAAGDLGLTPDDIVDAVLSLGLQHFYKSMEAHSCPGLWQDVYHLKYRGTWMYIKLQLNSEGMALWSSSRRNEVSSGEVRSLRNLRWSCDTRRGAAYQEDGGPDRHVPGSVLSLWAV
jgi:hypothetical protein